MSPGEKRRRAAKRQREHVSYAEAMIPLRAAGASCETCLHRNKIPPEYRRSYCDLESDHTGYMPVTPTYLCSRYERKP